MTRCGFVRFLPPPGQYFFCPEAVIVIVPNGRPV